jgi:rSAM/selenodomain-associated transferase 2
MPPVVTVVVPVLCDTEAVARLLPTLPVGRELEVIVVDGADDPRLAEVVAAHGSARRLQSTAGRARQMNTGAAVATGDWLFFLHADSTLPDGWFNAINQLDPGTAGAWFRFALDDDAWQARVIERLTAWRVRRLRLPYGDQGIVVRRRTFEQLGGFADLPLMEDVEFVRRLTRAGPVEPIPLPLVTSARRWRRDGWFRRSTINVALVVLYFLGVSPATLARGYRSAGPG